MSAAPEPVATPEEEDEDFAMLFASFNAEDSALALNEEDGELIESISANLREIAGLEDKKGDEPQTNWTAPSAPGLDNSGSAAEESVASSRRRRASEAQIEIEEEMWAELASPTERQRVGLPSAAQTAQKRRARGKSREIKITLSDNLLSGLDAIESRTAHLAKDMPLEDAKWAAEQLDQLAAHARCAPRLEKDALQQTLKKVEQLEKGADIIDLLKAVADRKNGTPIAAQPPKAKSK